MAALVCLQILVTPIGGNQVKTLRRICAATILSTMLTVSVSAGDIHSPGVASTGTGTPPAVTSVILVIVSLIYR